MENTFLNMLFLILSDIHPGHLLGINQLINYKMIFCKKCVLVRFEPTIPYALDRCFNQLSYRKVNGCLEKNAKLTHTLHHGHFFFTIPSLFPLRTNLSIRSRLCLLTTTASKVPRREIKMAFSTKAFKCGGTVC